MPTTDVQPFVFAEQIAFLRQKTNLPTRSWVDVWRSQHDVAFMVAGAYKADLLNDLREAVNQAITDHRDLDDFRKDFDSIVSRHGWSYNGKREWRTRTIFETNLRASYQAGRYAQLTEPAFLARYPLWRYRHSDAVLNPRPLHLAWNNLVLAADDPWWKTHYPPNGWGCKCTVYAESAASAARKGYPVAPRGPDNGSVTAVVGKNSAIPQQVTVPAGIDPGWDYAPGARAAETVRRVIARLPELPPAIGASLWDSVRPLALPQVADTFATLMRRVANDKVARGTSIVVGAIPPTVVADLATAGIRPVSADLVVSDDKILHATRLHKASPVLLEWLLTLPERLDKPRAIVLDTTHATPALLYVWDLPGGATDRNKVVINLDYKLKKTVTNVFNTATVVDRKNLAGPRHQVLYGSI